MSEADAQQRAFAAMPGRGIYFGYKDSLPIRTPDGLPSNVLIFWGNLVGDAGIEPATR